MARKDEHVWMPMIQIPAVRDRQGFVDVKPDMLPAPFVCRAALEQKGGDTELRDDPSPI